MSKNDDVYVISVKCNNCMFRDMLMYFANGGWVSSNRSDAKKFYTHNEAEEFKKTIHQRHSPQVINLNADKTIATDVIYF